MNDCCKSVELVNLSNNLHNGKVCQLKCTCIYTDKPPFLCHGTEMYEVLLEEIHIQERFFVSWEMIEY